MSVQEFINPAFEGAASGSGSPAPSADQPLVPSRSGNQDVRRAAVWLASSMPLCPPEGLRKWREVFQSVVNQRATLAPARSRGAGVTQEETLVNGQSPCVALYYATTGAVVRAVARIDPSLLQGPVGVTALVRAAGANLVDVMRELLIGGVDPNDSNAPVSSGGSPVHTAALKGHVRCLHLLAKHRANVNARLPHGGTPLHVAALHGHTDCLAVLIALSADVNAACAHGLTPLHVAVLAGYADCVALLMTKANSRLRDARGHEPICYAIEKEDVVIWKAIVGFQRYHPGSNIPVPQDGYPTCGHNMARIYEACSSQN